MNKTKHKMTWKAFHKWGGLVMTVFILLFCVSGIVLNHREAVSSCSVSRSFLPAGYHIKSYNNGVIKGTLPLSGGRVMAYGSGVWLTDRNFSAFRDLGQGLPEGADRRNIRNIVRSADDSVWCATQYGVYRLIGSRWNEVQLPGNTERISDIALDKEGHPVATTRSALYYLSGGSPKKIRLDAPEGYENKVSLFKTVWHLHSGELFGMAGRIVVDLVALVIIFLCVTGIILFILPYSIRRSLSSRVKGKAAAMKWNFREHSRIGYFTIVLTLLIAVTGTCLRPPLMIPLVMGKTAPLPGSDLDSDNPWHDRLRAMRWDSVSGEWLLSTSEGFFTVDKDFTTAPVAVRKPAPPVSPMGVTVLDQRPDGKWIVGSFSGLFLWDRADSSVTDYITKKPWHPQKGGRPIASDLVSGFSRDLAPGDVMFDYSKGAVVIGKNLENHRLADQPAVITNQPMSLWNFALELHVGRCYSPFLGPVSDLFVFLSGTLLTLILLSGLIVHNRIRRRRRCGLPPDRQPK